MSGVDSKGKLWGRVSLVDLAALALLGAVLLPSSYFAYCASGLKEIELKDVTPNRVVVGEHLRLKIRGSGFPQDCRVKLSTVDLGRPALNTGTSLEADIPPDLPPGWYHVIINGKRRSGVAIMPIIAVWKPEAVSVELGQFGVAEEEVLEITGKRFQADTKVFLAGVPLPEVEHVSESLLRVKVPPGAVPPGSHTLRLINPLSGEEFTRGQPISVLGKKSVPLYVVMLLEDLAPERADYLRRITAGTEPIQSPDTVQFVHVLSKEENPAEEKKKPKTKKKKKGPEPGVSVQIAAGLTGTVEYDGTRFLFSYQDQPLEPVSKINFRMNGIDFTGEVQSKPVVREPRYTQASK